jgi:hypothetical protein
MANRAFNTAVRFFNILVFKKKGQVPTVPVLLDIDQQNPLWKIPTDLLDGEYCINNKDKLVFIRIYDKIYTINIAQLPNVIALSHARLHALNSTLDHSSTITPGDIIDADGNGLPHDSGITTASLLALLSAVSTPPETYYATAGQTVFPTTLIPNGGTLVYVDGQLQTQNWGIVAGHIQMNTGLLDGQKIDIYNRL